MKKALQKRKPVAEGLVRVRFEVRESDHEAFRRRAEAEDLSMAQWMRRACRRALESEEASERTN